MHLSIADSSNKGRTFVVTVAGELDIGMVPQLTRQLDVALNAPDANIRVELEETTFIDSSGLGALAWAHRAAKGRLRLIGVQPKVAAVFQTVGLEDILV